MHVPQGCVEGTGLVSGVGSFLPMWGWTTWSIRCQCEQENKDQATWR